MIPTLQSLRFIFVMMIVMSHFSYHDITAFDAGGDCGVAFFFLLSGFVLSLGYGDKIDNGTFRFSDFIRKRLLKFYPLHLLCLLFFLLAFRPKTGLNLVFNVLLLQSWIPVSDYYFSYNGVSWFLSTILFCYFIFPLAYRYASRTTLIVGLLCCAAVYLFVPYDMINAVLYVNPLVRAFDFFLGIMLGRFFKARGSTIILPAWSEILLILLLMAALVAYPQLDAKWRNAPLFWIILLPTILVFAQGRGPLSAVLKCRLLQWLGEISLPIFLIHPLVFRTMFHYFPMLPAWVMLITCLSVLILVSWAVNTFILSFFTLNPSKR